MEKIGRRFVEKVMGCPIEECIPVSITPVAAGAALFALAEHLQALCPSKGEDGLPALSEAALTAGLKSMAELDLEDAFKAMRPPLRWAVRQRISDLIDVSMANEAAGKPSLTILPDGFPKDQVGLAVLLLMGIGLPEDLRR